MQALEHDPTLALMLQETESVLRTARDLDDQGLSAPSLLSGWSRGHLLTHLARNADGFANLARTAVTGVEQPMYSSRQEREAQIEQGAGRSLAEQLADLEQSAAALHAVLVQVPAAAIEQRVATGMGAQYRVGDLPWMRLRELAYHHVDLGSGVTFADLPDEVLRLGLAECAGRATLESAGITARCQLSDAEDLVVHIGDGTATVSGTAAQVLAGLTGRSDGTGVVTDDGRPLPDVPAWG